jgi:hypothetical protein
MTMLNSMKLWAIQSLVTALMTQLDAKAIRAFVDAGLDAIEGMVDRSETTVDDQFVLPMIAQTRKAFDLAD